MTLVRPDGPVPISGSGTSNTVAMFTGSLTLGDSVITQNSSQIGISTGAISARLHITGSGTTNATFTIKANNASVNTFYIRDDAEAGFSDDGINYFTIRQLASATYFKTSGTSGYVFNNASDATNIGKISNTGQILFGDITDTNYAGAGIAIKATGLTSNVAKEIFAVFYKNNTDNDGIFLASKQNNCYVQPYSPSNVNQTLILGGRNSASGPFETLTLNSSGRATITNTSEQLRIAYDSSNYATWTTSSTGSVTISAAGGSGVGVFDFNTIINGGGTTVRSINTSTGTAAYSAFGLENSANSAVLFKLSTLYTTNGLFTANALVIQNAGNIAFNASTGNSILLGVNNTEYARVNSTALTLGIRMLQKQGADVASATNLTLGSDGNAFEITGTTTIDLILITGWQNGSVVRLVFNESLTVRHGIATSGSNVTILLAGAANFSATANDTLTLMLCETTAGGQAWREVARSVN